MTDTSGPDLETYIETRLNLLEKRIEYAETAARERLNALDRRTDTLLGDADVRYQQRFEAQSTALAAALLSQQTAMQVAFVASREAVNAALAAADRAVQKAEVATDKRFESVNEFRATLSDQQRLLVARGEYEAQIAALSEKIDTNRTGLERINSERMGIKGGWGYAAGLIGAIVGILSLVGWVLKAGVGG